MNKALWTLAVQALKARKRSTLLLFLVLALSLALAVVTVSVTESIARTNENYRLDSYGAWHMGIVSGAPEDEAVLRGEDWLDTLGIAKSYGQIATPTGESGIGVVDETYLALGRVRLQSGRLPEKPGEIAVEGGLLTALGYDHTVGQEITVPVTCACTPAKIRDVTVENTFTLTGVIREYSGLWNLPYNRQGRRICGAFLLEEDAAALLEQAGALAGELRRSAEAEVKKAKANGEEPETYMVTEAMTKLEPAGPNWQYFFTVRDGMERTAQERLRAYLFDARWGTDADRLPNVNDAARLPEQESAVNYVYTALIFVVTLLAVFCIYTIQMQNQVRQIVLFRSIGITKRQLRVILFYETVAVCVPASLLGTAGGALGTWALLRLAVYSGSVPVQVTVPLQLLWPVLLVWLLGVLMTRLLALQLALRGRLTGRMALEPRKARRLRQVQKAVTALLSALLCAALFFTVLEAAGPVAGIREWNRTCSYQIDLADDAVGTEGEDGSVVPIPLFNLARKVQESATQAAAAYTQRMRAQAGAGGTVFDEENDPMADPKYWLDAFARQNWHLGQITESTLASLRSVPGVTRVEAQTDLTAKLPEEGMEGSPYYLRAAEAYRIRNKCGRKNGGARGSYLNGVEVFLRVYPEEQWAECFDTGLVDLDAFRRGDQVLLAVGVNEAGEYAVRYPVVTDEEKGLYEEEWLGFGEMGFSPGDTLTLEFYSDQTRGAAGLRTLSLGTVQAEVGGIMKTDILPGDGAYPAYGDGYTVLCSLGYIERVLKSVKPLYSIGSTYMTSGSPLELGYQTAWVYTDLNSGYLATNANVVRLTEEGGFALRNDIETHTAHGQKLVQELILVLLAGACASVVLVLIIGNTLTLETAREARHYGVLQALGLSRRQLAGRVAGAALGRGVLSALGGWAAFAGYAAFRARGVTKTMYRLLADGTLVEEAEGLEKGFLHRYAGVITGGTPVEVPAPFREALSTLAEGYRSAGVTGEKLLLLTAAGILLVFAVSVLSKGRLFREDLMGKLRDES